MKKAYLFFAVMISASVLGSDPESEVAGERLDVMVAVDGEVWTEDPNILECQPKILVKGGSFEMRLGEGHGKELAIRRNADERSYFLVVGGAPDEMKLLMTPAKFKEARSVFISTETVGFPWEKDGVNEVIFEEPGKYTVYVSEVLESECGPHACTGSFPSRSEGW